MKRLVFTLLFGISVLAAAAQEFGQVCTEKVPDEIHHFDRYKVNSQFYDADLIEQKNDRGVQRWFCNDTIMDGFYRGLPYIEYYGPSVFDGFDLRYSVYKFKDGIRNDTVRDYRADDSCLVAEVITLDSIRKIYKDYYDNGHLKILAESSNGKLDGIWQKWHWEGRPLLLRHYKDGEQCGEEKIWYGNGYLSGIWHYADGQQIFPHERWYYSDSEDEYSSKAPDWYKIEYSLMPDQGSDYTLTEIFTIGKDGAKRLTASEYYECGDLVHSTYQHCDSVVYDTLCRQPQQRLEVRGYLRGRLREYANYPLDNRNMDSTLGPYFESYSEAGELTEKYVYDFNRERTVPVRLYKNTGVTVTDITSAEYVKLLADSCNMPLDTGAVHIWKPDSLVVELKKRQMLLLNYLSDYYGVLWRYDGYNSRAGMHVLNCVRPEEKQYFAIDHTSGVSTELFCSYTPVCCGKSDLFLTCYEEPYAWEKPVNVVYIYKVLPGGKIAQVASCDRGAGFGTLDLDNFIWVGEHTLVATKVPREEPVQLYFGEPYGNFLEGDECEENDDGISYAKRYVRIEIDPPALEKADPLPTIEKLEEENNEWVKFTIQENDQVVTEERDGGEEFDG